MPACLTHHTSLQKESSSYRFVPPRLNKRSRRSRYSHERNRLQYRKNRLCKEEHPRFLFSNQFSIGHSKIRGIINTLSPLPLPSPQNSFRKCGAGMGKCEEKCQTPRKSMSIPHPTRDALATEQRKDVCRVADKNHPTMKPSIHDFLFKSKGTASQHIDTVAGESYSTAWDIIAGEIMSSCNHWYYMLPHQFFYFRPGLPIVRPFYPAKGAGY